MNETSQSFYTCCLLLLSIKKGRKEVGDLLLDQSFSICKRYEVDCGARRPLSRPLPRNQGCQWLLFIESRPGVKVSGKPDCLAFLFYALCRVPFSDNSYEILSTILFGPSINSFSLRLSATSTSQTPFSPHTGLTTACCPCLFSLFRAVTQKVDSFLTYPR